MQGQVSDLLKPRNINVETISAYRARVELEPMERGFGHTLGNALRRILLSSIPGAAVTEVQIEGVVHEYAALEGVQEDVIDILLNIKNLALRLNARDEATLTLKKSGSGPVTAGDITLDHDVEIINPELEIANLTGGSLDMTLHVTRGRGYQPVTQRGDDDDGATIGQLRLDASVDQDGNMLGLGEVEVKVHTRNALGKRAKSCQRRGVLGSTNQSRGNGCS